jgi:hypothetical protein
MNRITIAVLALVALAVIIILASRRSNNAVGQAKPPGPSVTFVYANTNDAWRVMYTLPKTKDTNTVPKAK